jgi:superfamily II DNA/RNA helicase
MARTGSGKTAAFLAPLIQRLVSLTAKDRSAGKV